MTEERMTPDQIETARRSGFGSVPRLIAELTATQQERDAAVASNERLIAEIRESDTLEVQSRYRAEAAEARVAVLEAAGRAVLHENEERNVVEASIEGAEALNALATALGTEAP